MFVKRSVDVNTIVSATHITVTKAYLKVMMNMKLKEKTSVSQEKKEKTERRTACYWRINVVGTVAKVLRQRRNT